MKASRLHGAGRLGRTARTGALKGSPLPAGSTGTSRAAMELLQQMSCMGSSDDISAVNERPLAQVHMLSRLERS